MARVIVVSGTVGAGKTTTAGALRHLLASHGNVCADIDLDALCQLSPTPAHDPFNNRLGLANLAAVWPNYVAAGATHLVLARVVEDPADRARYAGALPGCELRIVRIEAAAETRARRLTAREEGAASREWHLARSDVLADRLQELDLDDLVISNEGRPIEDVAAEILERLGW